MGKAPRPDPRLTARRAIYEQAGQIVLHAARAAGWNAELEVASDWFRGITIWRPGTNRERDGVGIDIGQEYRTRSVQRMSQGGLVMDLDDISAGKCRALCDRREAHDFADVACLLMHPGWNLDRLYANAKTAVPNLTLDEFRELLHSVDSLSDRELDESGVSANFIRSVLRRV